jgi:hypothetical protein
MKNNRKYADLAAVLRIDCEKCSGLCCVALYCMKTDGFPDNKQAGIPCKHLLADFCCDIHGQLANKKMRGCLAYDCFGAGQKVTQSSYAKENWKTNPEKANEIFQVFMIVFQLHQMAWYLLEASSLVTDKRIIAEVDALIAENIKMTALAPAEILQIDLTNYQTGVNLVLKKVSNQLAADSFDRIERKDYFGKNFKRVNLNGRDFSMALMIAANLEGCSLTGTNFLGADLRDANIKNTDLRESLFLTQMQINAAQGNAKTKLPSSLCRPSSWD